jgi:predicted nucleic acid-binding protein
MNGGRAFFDTNVLVYMHSRAFAAKQERAQNLFEEYADAGRILLSTQVVQEFFAAGLRKLGMPWEVVRSLTMDFMALPLIRIGPPHIVSAIDATARYNISFWDALILAAAESGGALVLFTEDLNNGQQYGSVTVRNPFA